MSEPGRRPVALRLMAAAIFLLLVAGGFWLRSRGAVEPPTPPPVAAVVPDAEPPAPPRLLGRAELVDAAAAAADAYAAGRGADGAAALAGRRFSMQIVFGCNGASPANGESPLRWGYDGKEQVLRISARPEAFTAAPWLTRIAGAGSFEAAEGFWIERPWQREAACPAYRSPLDSSALTLPRQTLAIAELFAAGAPRSARRDDRPYEFTAAATPDEVAALRGFVLVVEGRVTALPNGAPIGCWSPTADVRPICAIGATFDRVSLQNIATGKTLADWRR